MSGFVIKNGVLTEYTGNGKNVVIPEGVTSIGNMAFCECKNLESVVIPEGVTSIDVCAFYKCESLESVVIPGSVKSIGNSAFYYCSSLKSVVIPEGATSVGGGAFCGCRTLESVVIPESVTSVGERAFYGCDSLKSVVIPEGVTSIGDSAFLGCKKLADENGFVIIRGILFDYYGDDENIIIPEGVTSIGDGAFEDCEKLESVVIPEGVTSIGDSAFLGCKSLTSVVIPEGVTSIGDSAFEDCEKLESVVIPEGVTSIGDRAFKDCKSLTSVVIPEGVTSIGKSTFEGCSRLRKIVIPEWVTSIGNWAFAYCKNLKSIVITEGVTSIGDYVFYECKNLESVVIPESVTSIGEEAFYGCKKLEYISPLNPSCKMKGKVFTNCKFAPKLISCLGGIYHAMTDSILKEALLNMDWSQMSIETQVEIFETRQGKPLLSAYPKCINGQDVETLGRQLLKQLNESPSIKLYKAVVNYIILLENDIPDDLLNQLYTCLKGQKGAVSALKSIEGHVSLMEKLEMDTTVDESLPPLEKMVQEKLLAEKQSVKDLEAKFKSFYSLSFSDLPELLKKDGSAAPPYAFAWLLTAHEKMEECKYSLPDVISSYEQPGVRPEAEKILAELDPNALQQALFTLADLNLGISGRSKKMFLAFPICRYADNELMAKLTKVAPSWSSHVSGNDAPPLRTFRMACIYSKARAAMLLADKYGDLNLYAKIRGTNADTIRDQFLSNVGLDPQGCKIYDLGNQTVVARLQKDLSFLVEVPGVKKPAKSIPKKGADEEKYATASADFSEMKKSVKKIIKNRTSVLLEDFLAGRKRRAADWEKGYLQNPLLRMVATLLVWQQGNNTFTLTDSGAINADETEYAISNKPIAVAHPMEMKAEELSAWQKYFVSKGLKQPFEQIWEPVIDPKNIKEDRYSGCMIPYYRFIGREKHGITVDDYDFHDNIVITFDDCMAEVSPIDYFSHYIDMNEPFEIEKFQIQKYSRMANHIVAYLDKVSAYGRVAKDDVSVAAVLPIFTLAQITEFIKIAQENSATNATALLLNYKNENFSDFDPMAEFTLD